MQLSTILTLVLGWLLLFSTGQPSAWSDEGVDQGSRPNIVLVMADDQGWGDVGFNGHERLKTPHLDKLASEGIQFNRWYAAAPVCSPTRGSCLTGRHPYRYGIYTANRGHLKSEEVGLQELLKEHGYATGHFGKWHLGTLTTKIKDANRGKPGNEKDYSPPWKHGFDACFSTESKVPTFNPMKNPNNVNKAIKKGVDEDGPYGTFYWTGPDQRVPDENLVGDDSMLIVKQASRFIQKAVNDDQPFFAVVWFHAPHLPVVAGKSHRDLYLDHPFGLYGQHYAGCISAIDDSVGHLRSELERLGVFDDTMIWYCADNGPEGSTAKGAGSAGPFRGRKRSLYEGGVRVPAFLTWPATINGGRSTDVPCVTSDYLPTILDILEIPVPPVPLDGVSLKPLIENRMKRRGRPIGFQSAGNATWNTDQYKLVVRKSGNRDKKRNQATPRAALVELYDLIADPEESNDIAASHPNVVAKLKMELQQWQASCKRSDRGEDY